MNYYDNIKNKLIENENYARIKDYSKERYKLNTYYEVGHILSKAGKKYGENIIKDYSEKLQIEVGKKYTSTTLKRMRQFYKLIQKGAPLAHQLSWSHYIELIPLKENDKIRYYINISIQFNLSRNQLREKIKNKE